MPTFPHVAHCDCDTVCPGAANCTCIHVFGPPERCCCTCDATPTPLTTLKAEDRVGISVRGSELGAVAEFVHRMTGVEVLIPASALRSRVDADVADATFADALAELGLALGPPPERAY